MIHIRKLEPSDRRDQFSCGVVELDEFLRRYAGQNQLVHHLGVTYVAIEDVSRAVLGYVTVTVAHASRDELPGIPASTPAYPLPLLRIARLAVDARAAGAGIGSALLLMAFELAIDQAQRVGCVGIIVDAKREAVSYYERFGFLPITARRGGPQGRPRQVPMFLALSGIRVALDVANSQPHESCDF